MYVYVNAYAYGYVYVYMYLYLHLYMICRWKGDRWLLYVMLGNSLSFDEASVTILSLILKGMVVGMYFFLNVRNISRHFAANFTIFDRMRFRICVNHVI